MVRIIYEFRSAWLAIAAHVEVCWLFFLIPSLNDRIVSISIDCQCAGPFCWRMRHRLANSEAVQGTGDRKRFYGSSADAMIWLWTCFTFYLGYMGWSLHLMLWNHQVPLTTHGWLLICHDLPILVLLCLPAVWCFCVSIDHLDSQTSAKLNSVFFDRTICHLGYRTVSGVSRRPFA